MLSGVMMAAVDTGVVVIVVAVAVVLVVVLVTASMRGSNGDAPPGMSRSAEISTTPKGE